MADLIFSNPIVVGALISTGLNLVKPMLKKLDDGKVLAQYSNFLHPLTLILTFVVSALQSGLTGHLADMDLSQVVNFVTFYLPTLVGAKAMTLADPAKK